MSEPTSPKPRLAFAGKTHSGGKHKGDPMQPGVLGGLVGPLKTDHEELQKAKRGRGRPRKYISLPIEDYKVYNGPMTAEAVRQIQSAKLPVIQECRKLAQVYCPAAILRLAHIALHSVDERASVVATNALLERGLGKVREAVEKDEPVGLDIGNLEPGELSTLRGILARALGIRENDADASPDIHVEDRDTGQGVTDAEFEPVGDHNDLPDGSSLEGGAISGSNNTTKDP